MMVKDEETTRGQGLTGDGSIEFSSASNSIHGHYERLSSTILNRNREEDSIKNILLIGPSQSGKSTLAEAIGLFFSPGSEIDLTRIGDGNLSCTKEVRMVEYESHFPEFELINTDSTSHISGESFYLPNQETPRGIKVDVPRFLDEKSHRKYKQKLNQYDDLEVYQAPPGSLKKYIFRIYDTPGLEDTDGEDVKNVANILEAVTKTDKFHLVLVTIPLGSHLSPGLQTALEDFRNMFSDMGGLFAFIHTKADFLSMHPENKKYADFLATRREKLDEIMGREVPYFVIDLCLEEDRPVCVYLRQRVIRDVFSLVRLNVPVPVDRIQLAKTKQMRVVDTNVIEACTWCLKDVERKQTEFLAKVEAIQAENACIKLRDITNLNCIADKHRGEIRKIEAELSDLDTEVHELFDEREDFQGWNIIDLFGQHPAEFRVTDLAYTIAEVRESGYGFEIEYIEGGQGHRHWIVRTKRHAWNNRLYRVEFYTERRTRNQEQIGHLKQDLFKQNDALQVLVNAMGTLEASGPKEDSPEIKMERMQIQTEQNKLFKVIALAGRIALHPKLFKAIAEAGVYESGPEEVTARVTEFYSEYVLAEGEEPPV